MSKLLVTGGAGFLALTKSLWVLLNTHNSEVMRKTTTGLKSSIFTEHFENGGEKI